MTDIASSSGMLTAFFEDRDDAQDAVDRLVEAGVPQGHIRLTAGNEAGSTTVAETEHKGFLESLADFFMPEEDRHTYAEGLRRGGYLVSVSGLSGASYDRALDILDDEGAIDLDARASEWREEGWTGYQSSDAGGIAASGYTGARASDRDTIPVVEEQLRVGKRDVNLGRVRVRSYVVEEPVSEDISLTNERVVLERRPVNRELGAGEADFIDRELEAEEHAEEAVVAKTARVTEEIALRKEREERQETVTDTVRHTEVEVEDDRDLSRQDTGTLGNRPRTR